MIDDKEAGVLKGLMVPLGCGESYRLYTESLVCYLERIRMLDRYYDHRRGEYMVFTTEVGRRCLDMYRMSLRVNDLRDVVIMDHDLSGERFREAVEKAISTDRWWVPCSTVGSLIRSINCLSSPCLSRRGSVTMQGPSESTPMGGSRVHSISHPIRG